MAKHRVFIALTLLELVAVAGLLALCRIEQTTATVSVAPAKIEIVDRLGLTDLAIWTEARYTRHPSQADLFSPFQDFPSSLEHFPAGSVVGTPDPSSFAQPAVR